MSIHIRWLKEWFWLLVRFMGYQAISLLWNVVLFPLCILLKRLRCPLFDYIFLVYPGELDQVRGYIPQWCRRIVPTVSVIGFVLKGKQGGRWLIVAVPWTITEMEQGDCLKVIVHQVNKLAKSIGAKSIALAGRLPSVFVQKGYAYLLSPPIVGGDKGIVYTIILSMKQITDALGMSISKINIGILGYGYIGSRLANSLHYITTNRIFARDLRFKQERDNYNGVVFSRDPAKLAGCDLVVILTATGEQAECAIEHLKPGVIVIDDTHPQMPYHLSNRIEKKGGRVFKAVLGLDGVVFRPRLPKLGD